MAKTIAELRGMQRAQLNKLNKDVIIDSILSSREDDGSQLHNKLEKISSELAQLRQDVTSPNSAINRKIESMQKQIDQQAKVIKQQQLFLETIDRKERETKLVLLGVPDEEEELSGVSTDDEKIRKVWSVIGDDVTIRARRRLGRRDTNSNRKRPILVELESKDVRDRILSKTKKLKEAGAPFERIFIKKDVHPAVRNEWKRLKEVEMVEKNRPENVGCTIRLDPRERKIYRDDVVIDQWNAYPF